MNSSVDQKSLAKNTPLWEPEDLVTRCHGFSYPFWWFLRKHHCRSCGKIFCYACCSYSLLLGDYGYNGLVPACKFCYEKASKIKSSQEIHVETAETLTKNLNDISELLQKESGKFDGNPSQRDNLSNILGSFFARMSQLGLSFSLSSEKAEQQLTSIKQAEEKIRSLEKQLHDSQQSRKQDSKKESSKSTNPTIERERKIWKVEYWEGRSDLVVSDTNPKQCVHVFKCSTSTIQIPGVISEILLDSCTYCTVIFQEVIASVNLINCKKIQIRCQIKVPSVQVEKSDGVTVEIPSDEIENARLLSSLSTDVCLLSQPKTKSGVPVEYAIPEQIIAELRDKQLVCTTLAK